MGRGVRTLKNKTKQKIESYETVIFNDVYKYNAMKRSTARERTMAVCLLQLLPDKSIGNPSVIDRYHYQFVYQTADASGVNWESFIHNIMSEPGLSHKSSFLVENFFPQKCFWINSSF